MGAIAGEANELQAFLKAHPRRLYRQGTGSIPIQAVRAALTPTRSESRPELLEELVASIKATGLIQPLIVRPVPGLPHQFEVVAGERRFKAAQLAGLAEIPAIIREFNDQEALAVSLIENIQREELSPADEARALKRLIEEFALTHEQVAHAIGRSRAAVTNLLRLLELPVEITSMIEARSISMGHARALLGIADDAERLRLAQLVATHQWSVRDTELQVRKAAQARSGRAPAAPPELALISEVTAPPGLRIELHQRANGTGKIVIEFDDAQARDAVLERLGAPQP
ncbi:MAG TPA: ParB/RepB/Spo0J family partition protein [Steroidobacteraceae bacterium]|jgi:ParB family chromosome partitioning protein|nr:ParB/RepB/Spo0J family partition protein [Steroidobacteraceae bacterium]